MTATFLFFSYDRPFDLDTLRRIAGARARFIHGGEILVAVRRSLADYLPNSIQIFKLPVWHNDYRRAAFPFNREFHRLG